jgi:hypothetical protein
MLCPFPSELLSSYALPEPWKADKVTSEGEQDWEAKLRDMETVLGRGNWLFWAISVVDQNWHTEVYENRVPYNPTEEAEIVDYYRAWLLPTGDLLARIKELESRNYVVTGAEKFRDNCREVRGLLTDDTDFFDGDSLSELQDRAIDAHSEGRTADFNVFGE